MAKTFTPEQRVWGFGYDATDAGWTVRVTQERPIMLNHTLAGDQQFQVRWSITETGSADGNTTDDWTVQFRRNGGTWTTPTGATSYVQVDTGSSLTDGNASTEQLTGGTAGAGGGGFISGVQEAGNAEVTNFQLTAKNYTELVFALKLIQADLSSGDILEFRVLLNGSTFSDATDGVPTVIVNDGPIIRGDFVGHNGTFDATAVITLPPQAAEGQLLVVCAGIDVPSPGSEAWGSQSGWTTVYDSLLQNSLVGVFWRILPASPPASYTLTASTPPSGGEDDSWTCYLIDGHDPTTPIDVNSINSGSSQTPSGSTVTPTAAGRLLLSMGIHRASDGTNALSNPTGSPNWARSAFKGSGYTGSNSQLLGFSAFSAWPSASAIGATSWSLDVTSRGWQVATLAIKAASTGPGGSGAQTAPTPTQSASGSLDIPGSAAQTAPTPSQAASGYMNPEAAAAQTAPTPSQSASGAEIFSGTAVQTAPTPTQAATGDHNNNATGTGAQTAPTPSQAASGAETIDGTGAQVAPTPTQDASALMQPDAVAAQTAPTPTQSATGTHTTATATGAGAQTAPTPTQAATGGEGIDATAAQTAPTPLQQATASEIVLGSASQTAPTPTQSASGGVAIAGTGAQTAPTPLQQAVASEILLGTAGQTAPTPTQQGTGSHAQDATGTAAQIAPTPTQQATGDVGSLYLPDFEPSVRRTAAVEQINRTAMVARDMRRTAVEGGNRTAAVPADSSRVDAEPSNSRTV